MSMAPEDRELLLALTARVEDLSAKVDRMAVHHDALSEALADVGPIGKAIVGVGSETLGDLEKRGYFAFGRELLGVADTVVTTYSPEDVRELAGAVVGILDTVRNLSQPDVLAIANEATNVLHDADQVEPIGPMKMIGATRDEDVQRGLAVMLEVLRHVGQATTAMGRHAARARPKPRIPGLAPSGRFAKRGAPSSSPSPPVAAKKEAPAPARAVRIASTPAVQLDLGDVDLDDGGYLADREAWTHDIARRIAAFEGVELTDAHWAILEAARADAASSGASPNIRRLTQVAEVSTKELYTLFPKAPGRTIARIAGLKKPAGCI